MSRVSVKPGTGRAGDIRTAREPASCMAWPYQRRGLPSSLAACVLARSGLLGALLGAEEATQCWAQQTPPRWRYLLISQPNGWAHPRVQWAGQSDKALEHPRKHLYVPSALNTGEHSQFCLFLAKWVTQSLGIPTGLHKSPQVQGHLSQVFKEVRQIRIFN